MPQFVGAPVVTGKAKSASRSDNAGASPGGFGYGGQGGGARGAAGAGLDFSKIFGKAGGPGLPAPPGMGGSTGVGSGSIDMKKFLSGKGGARSNTNTGVIGPGIGGAGGSSQGGGFGNYSDADPDVSAAQKKLNDRYKQLAGREGQMDPFLMESINKLRERESADTTNRAIDRAGSQAGDWAAGMKERMAAQNAASGRGAGAQGGAIEGAAQRLQAKQAADISLGRERDLDNLALQGHNIRSSPSNLKLAQTGQTNDILGNITGSADMNAKLGLARQQLGLDEWNSQNDWAFKNKQLEQQGQMGQLDFYLELLRASGY